MRSAGRTLLGATLAFGAALATRASAQTALPDSALMHFMGSYADSSDRYFGLSAAPADTAGLDSTLSYYLGNPEAITRMRRGPSRFSLPSPDYRFNRVDGNYWGARADLGNSRTWGRIEGGAGYAAGQKEWLGSAHLIERRDTNAGLWSLDGGWDKSTDRMDPNHRLLSIYWVRALLNGSDRLHYLRREGASVSLRHDTRRTTLIVGYRDQRERPLQVTALWNLFGSTPAVSDNLQARKGHVRAYSVAAGAGVGPWPIELWVENQTSARGMGSDFDYRRWLAAAGTIWPVVPWASLALQGNYGTLREDVVPQAAFMFGGSHSLRSIPGFSMSGTRTALARAEVIFAPDLLQVTHLPHPSFLNLEASVTGAVGSAWGIQPFTGANLGGDTWPERASWLSEAGAALLYRPGIPDPWGFIRLDWAWPVGNNHGPVRTTFSYVQTLHLLPSIGR